MGVQRLPSLICFQYGTNVTQHTQSNFIDNDRDQLEDRVTWIPTLPFSVDVFNLYLQSR